MAARSSQVMRKSWDTLYMYIEITGFVQRNMELREIGKLYFRKKKRTEGKWKY